MIITIYNRVLLVITLIIIIIERTKHDGLVLGDGAIQYTLKFVHTNLRAEEHEF